MRIVNKEEFNIYQQDLLKHLDEGSLFVHPTDTVYGIGCDATNEQAVQKVREAKQRPGRPFSVIAPSKEWIQEHCDVTEEDLEHLPGPVTLVLKLKNQEAVAKSLTQDGTLGVRMPEHWIQEAVTTYGKPVVSTSVNLQGEQYAKTVDDIHHSMVGKITFAINEGKKEGKPSTIINTIKNETIDRE